MADRRITELAAISTLDVADQLVVVDVSDTTMAATGTDKKVTPAQLLGATTGDVTHSGFAATITAGAVTYPKIQAVAASRLLGNPTGSAASPAEIGLGANLSFSGSNLVAAGGGTVTSVGMTVPSILAVTPASITTSGTFAMSLATQAANTVWAGPTSGSAAAPSFRSIGLADVPAVIGGLACGRLSLSSVNPYPTGDQVGMATLYYLPAAGTMILLWNNTAGRYELVTIPAAGWSLSLSGTVANTIYDIFVQNNENGTASIGTGAAWTNDSTRFVPLSGADGMLFAGTGANKNLRYVGTIRTVGAGACDDSFVRRYVWNAYNQVPKRLRLRYTAAGSWTYTNSSASTTIARFINNDSTAWVNFVIGGGPTTACPTWAEVEYFFNVANVSNGSATFAIALDQTSTYNSPGGGVDLPTTITGSQQITLTGRWADVMLPGRHWINLIERLACGSTTPASVTGYGNGWTGIEGYVMG